MEVVFLWVALSVAVSIYASRRGRIGFIAFLWSLIFSPVIVFLIYAAMGQSASHRKAQIIEEERIRAEARRQLNG